MLRDQNLIPLSHQHQHTLALCVRIDRATAAGDADVAAFEAEVEQIVQQEIAAHFVAEEKELFPAAAKFPELSDLVEELRSEHTVLRDFFSRAKLHQLHLAGLRKLGESLSAHIRKEERQLFERIQQLMSAEELAEIGSRLNVLLAQASDACLLPNEATKLRPQK